MNKKCIASFQFLPIGKEEKMIEDIDQIIELIRTLQLKFQVTPFETVVEGSFNEIQNLLSSLYSKSMQLNCNQFLLNMKLHINHLENLSFEKNTEKYSI